MFSQELRCTAPGNIRSWSRCSGGNLSSWFHPSCGRLRCQFKLAYFNEEMTKSLLRQQENPKQQSSQSTAKQNGSKVLRMVIFEILSGGQYQFVLFCLFHYVLPNFIPNP